VIFCGKRNEKSAPGYGLMTRNKAVRDKVTRTDVTILKIQYSPSKLRKIGVFGSKQTYIKQNFDHNVGF
jgi:hypothetical protein